MSLKGLGTGKEQGPKGRGQAFESCRVCQESMCRELLVSSRFAEVIGRGMHIR